MTSESSSTSSTALSTPLGMLRHIGKFQPEAGQFSVYMERFELFLEANDVQEPRKYPYF